MLLTTNAGSWTLEKQHWNVLVLVLSGLKKTPIGQIGFYSVSEHFLIPLNMKCMLNVNWGLRRAKFSFDSSSALSDAIVALVEPFVGFTSSNPLLVASSFVLIDKTNFYIRVLDRTCYFISLYPLQTIPQITSLNEYTLPSEGFYALNALSEENLTVMFKSKIYSSTTKDKKKVATATVSSVSTNTSEKGSQRQLLRPPRNPRSKLMVTFILGARTELSELFNSIEMEKLDFRILIMRFEGHCWNHRALSLFP